VSNILDSIWQNTSPYLRIEALSHVSDQLFPPGDFRKVDLFHKLIGLYIEYDVRIEGNSGP
jgi:hypothetical protein